MARWRAALALLIVLGGLPSALRAQVPNLTAEETTRIAEQFAPVLVFHAEEKYFPVNPLFSIESEVTGSAPGSLAPELGTPESRRDAYRALTMEQKAKLTTIYYRAYPAQRSGGSVIVLEYWFYYVWDEYRVRSNVLPVWANGSHPNDLEHIHLILRAESGRFVVDEVFASAHEGKIPANRYKYDSAGHAGPTHFFVELGSHALAPDVIEDGVFVPGMDGNSGSKILWGVRDRGYTWPRYSQSYMNLRTDGNAVVFTRETDTLETDKGQRFSYRLLPVDSLMESFTNLNLTDSERKHAFENQTFWFKRLFGRDNGRSDQLLVPKQADGRSKTPGVRGVSSSERRFLAGTALNNDEPGMFVGGRYSFLMPSIWVPDLMFQVDGVVTKHNRYLSPQFLLGYPLDGFTRIMVGKSLVTDTLDFSRRQWDTQGTIEVRLGEMRISATTRSTGPLRTTAKEFRLFYSFGVPKFPK
jgi:hypothetical protein